MYYDTIKKEIGKRLGDPLLDKYRALVGPVFAESVGSIILAEDYSPYDIQNDPENVPYPLMVTHIFYVTEGFYGSQTVALPSDLVVVQNVSFQSDFYINWPPSIPHYRPLLKEIDVDTRRKMSAEDALKPAAYEIFYLISDYYIHFWKSNEWELGNGNVPIKMYYLKSPSNDVWQNLNSIIFDGLNLETDVGLSPQLLMRAINKSVISLAGGEKGEQ